MKKTARKFVSRSRKHGILAIIGGVVVATIIVFVIVLSVNTDGAGATAAPRSDPRFAPLTAGTSMTSEIPATLPTGGVTIDKQFVLRPLTSLQLSSVKVTASRAIRIGRIYANAQPFAATTLLASFTSINPVPPSGTTEQSNVIQNVPAWIITFTTSNPQNVIIGKKPAPGQTPVSVAPRHFNIVINASTGAFVLGFFTM